jgi:hypothetical protein
LRRHCRYHHKRRNEHFGSKAHREPPDVDVDQSTVLIDPMVMTSFEISD